MVITSKDIGVPFVISLMVNILSAYLFSLEKISLNTLIFIIIISILVIIIIGVQLRSSEIKDEQDAQKLEQKRLGESLKYMNNL